MNAPPLHVVAVCYHLAPAPFAGRLAALAARAGRRLQGVVVGNNPAHDIGTVPTGFEFVRGSNAHLDFSGYFEGLERLIASDPEADARNVLFANDSLLTAHAGAAIVDRLLALDAVLGQLEVPGAAGKLDPYRSICLTNPWSGQAAYLSTYCFLLNARALPVLRGLPADAAGDGVLAVVAPGDPAWGSGLDPRFREYIRAHLLYRGSPDLWRGAATAVPETIRRKAHCVYFEHRLSGRLGLQGALLPINAGPRSKSQVAAAELLARVGRTLGGHRP